MSEEEAIKLLKYKILMFNNDVYLGDSLDKQNIEAIKVLLKFIEQLQQKNTDLQIMVNFPSLKITTCPKCGERYSINYCKEVYKLEEENKTLKEQLKGTTHCYDEEEHQKLIKNNEYYEKENKLWKDLTIRQAHDLEIKDNILTEFEKWLEELINYLGRNKESYEDYRVQILTYRYCLDKLQELKKEGKK